MEKFRIEDKYGTLEIRLVGNSIQFSTTPDHQEVVAELSKFNALRIAQQLTEWASPNFIKLNGDANCKLCQGRGEYNIGGSFGGGVTTYQCNCAKP